MTAPRRRRRMSLLITTIILIAAITTAAAASSSALHPQRCSPRDPSLSFSPSAQPQELPDGSILHAIRIHGLNDTAAVCVLSVAGWTGRRWSLQSRLRLGEGECEAIVRLKRVPMEEEEPNSSGDDMPGPRTPAAMQIALRGVGSQQRSRSRRDDRWLLQLQCFAISQHESGPEHILRVHPRNGIVAQSTDGEVVHHFTVESIAPSKPILSRSWLHRAWRRWAAPPMLRLRYTIEEAADRASEWPPIREWLRLCSFVFTLLYDAALNVHGRCSGWLLEVLRHSAFVAIFNAWRTVWIEVQGAWDMVRQALPSSPQFSAAPSFIAAPSSFLSALSLIAQLSFVHLVLMFYFLHRHDVAASPQRRRARLRALSKPAAGPSSALGESSRAAASPRNNMAVSQRSIHKPAAPSPKGIAGFFARLFQRGSAPEAAAATASSSSPRALGLSSSTSHVPRSFEQRLPLVLPPAIGSALHHATEARHSHHPSSTPSSISLHYPSSFALQHPSSPRESLGRALTSAAAGDEHASPESSMERKHEER